MARETMFRPAAESADRGLGMTIVEQCDLGTDAAERGALVFFIVVAGLSGPFINGDGSPFLSWSGEKFSRAKLFSGFGFSQVIHRLPFSRMKYLGISS